ncbi:MAG: hypothetical protein KAG37_07885 [Flavobacteriales bacterium]|nr:hypothetical protein [Flavobacteriales bacterium]
MAAPQQIDIQEPLQNNYLPILKKGELATDGSFLYLCSEHDQIEVFMEEQMFLFLKELFMAMHNQSDH